MARRTYVSPEQIASICQALPAHITTLARELGTEEAYSIFCALILLRRWLNRFARPPADAVIAIHINAGRVTSVSPDFVPHLQFTWSGDSDDSLPPALQATLNDTARWLVLLAQQHSGSAHLALAIKAGAPQPVRLRLDETI